MSEDKPGLAAVILVVFAAAMLSLFWHESNASAGKQLYFKELIKRTFE